MEMVESYLPLIHAHPLRRLDISNRPRIPGRLIILNAARMPAEDKARTVLLDSLARDLRV